MHHTPVHPRHARLCRALPALAGAALAVSTFAAPALAGPVEARHVPESARWVAQVDLQAMADTQIGGFLLEQIDRESEGYKDIRQALPGFTLAPEGGMKGLTLYGHSLEDDAKEEFVAMIYGDERIADWGDQLDAVFRAHGVESASIEVRGTKVWPVPMDEGNAGTLYAGMLSRADQRLWVLAMDLPRLTKALAHVKGGAEGNAALSGITWKDGTIGFAAVKDPSELADFEEMSSVIGNAKSILARVGEADGRAFAEAAVHTDAPEKADQIARVLDGLVALGTMMGGSDPELAKVMEFARSVRIESEGGKLRVGLSHDAGEVVQLLREAERHDDWDHDDHEHHGDHHDDTDDGWGSGWNGEDDH